jgi:uncharacterized membrane-anchored protein YhcB (DUF1043 family)
MIKFFRRIRQNLIVENRFSKYLLYAIGEIILVVIGILLALQFNNWNIERENSTKERWYLINIVEDIEYQKEHLKDIKSHYEQSIATAKSLLKEYRKLKSFAKMDSLNFRLNLIMIVENFPNTNNTYLELVNSGQQTLISDKDLSIDIIDYYLFCEDNYINMKNNNDNVFYKEIHPVLYGLHQTILSEIKLSGEENFLRMEDAKTQEYLRQKLETPENTLRLINALKNSILINSLHLEMVKETQEAGIDLIKKIDAYLGLTPDMVNHYN